MQIGKCANCIKKILIQGLNVIACKCRELFFCSTSCYKVAIKAHKKVCPFFTNKNSQPTFSSPYSQPQAPLPLPTLKRHDRVPAESCSMSTGDYHDSFHPPNNSPQLQSHQISDSLTNELTKNPRTNPSSQNLHTNPSFLNLHTNSSSQNPPTNPSSQNPLTNPSSQNHHTNSSHSSQVSCNNSSSEFSSSLSSRDISTLPGSHVPRKRKRGRSGVYAKESEQGLPKEPPTDEQKRKNAIASRVSKHKDAIVSNCRKIKILRLEFRFWNFV